eukprot:CAMPEP_0119071362 /NCGR_PEP_ID=MMETSP1178-20130426/49060_1 /TAXON_ID=33656 /ORGANISM="unid sp, Strain CCMP2000" /LENGTH=54 /DNA_ID=CAMNT_0007053285 /DNA_START=453 /DNA_END=614 /DNA_ORIENTATION=+
MKKISVAVFVERNSLSDPMFSPDTGVLSSSAEVEEVQPSLHLSASPSVASVQAA